MGQFLSANEELLAVIQVGNTTVVLFLLFLLLYWHVLSLHLILPVKTRIIFKSLDEVCKQTTVKNVIKRDNCWPANTAFVFPLNFAYTTVCKCSWEYAVSQEHLMSMVYAKFGEQTKCVMGNAKKENTKEVMHPLQWKISRKLMSHRIFSLQLLACVIVPIPSTAQILAKFEAANAHLIKDISCVCKLSIILVVL